MLRWHIPLVVMAANRPRNREKEPHCARRLGASTISLLAIDGRRDATDVGCAVGVDGGVTGSRWRAWFGALALLVLSACSNGDDAGPDYKAFELDDRGRIDDRCDDDIIDIHVDYIHVDYIDVLD